MSVPLVVESRPALEHVISAANRHRLTHAQRSVLVALALDSYDGETAAPGYDALAAWTGLMRGTVAQVLSDLLLPTSSRPAMLAKDGYRSRRTVWRLLTESSSLAGRDVESSSPAAQDDMTSGTRPGTRPDTRPGNRPGNRPARPDDNPSPPSHATPTPQPPVQDVTPLRVVSAAEAGPHEHEPNARAALASLVSDRALPLSVPELLEHAYRLGNGDPWAGHRVVRQITDQPLTGARDPRRVLATRLAAAHPVPVVTASAQQHVHQWSGRYCGLCAASRDEAAS